MLNNVSKKNFFVDTIHYSSSCGLPPFKNNERISQKAKKDFSQ